MSVLTRKIIVIGGPTASGKSAIALDIAARYNGIIINADSMQIYKDIPIISAQPNKTDQTTILHNLYGIFQANELCSVARWIELAAEQIDLAHNNKRIPIIVGGTGLYIKSLIYGLSKIPEITKETREKIRRLHQTMGQAELHKLLRHNDPNSAMRININDPQRTMRALEVFTDTGIPLSKWQTQPPKIFYEHKQFIQLYLDIDRPTLYENCNNRFDEMIKLGAIEEVANLDKLEVPYNSNVRKALGVREINEYLKGYISLDEALIQAKQATRNYAKRQITWFNNQMRNSVRISHNNFKEIIRNLI
jgi:tRNA dimethylallyltransferase